MKKATIEFAITHNHWNAQDRTAKILGDETTVGLGAMPLHDDRAEPRSKAGANRNRQGGFVSPHLQFPANAPEQCASPPIGPP